jgi:transposase
MIPDISEMKIFIRPGFTDMRKAINGLSVKVQEEMKEDPFSKSLFIFCNKPRKILKILYWDNNGFCLWQKRLEKHKFPWPESEEDVQELDIQKLNLLLKGIDFWKAHDKLTFKEVF